jgi:phytanoyl-CoA hydroxylase
MHPDRLTPQELETYRQDGFVVARALASAERVAALRDLVLRHLREEIGPAEYEADLHYPGAPASRDAPGGSTTRRLLQAYARHPAFRDWASSSEATGALRQLLGEGVMLSQSHHNCAMTKQPRYSSLTGWHQDIRYWSFQRPELVSLWLALGREFPDNGCLWFLPGSHLMNLARERLDDALFLREDLPENQTLIATRVAPRLEPGDAVYFHCRTFHAAGSNRTDQPKLSLVFTYHAADNAPVAGTRSASLPSIEV